MINQNLITDKSISVEGKRLTMISDPKMLPGGELILNNVTLSIKSNSDEKSGMNTSVLNNMSKLDFTAISFNSGGK